MQNSSPAAKAVVAQQANGKTHPLIPPEWGPTVSAVSVLIAALALIVSGIALRNTRRAARQSAFDNHYGDAIRTGLRELEDACSKLRAYSFPSKGLNELKNEVPGVQGDIEEKAFRIASLLGEVDASKSTKCKGWCKAFDMQIETAGLKLESSTNPSVSTEIQFRTRIEAARDLYAVAIQNARHKLEAVRSKA